MISRSDRLAMIAFSIGVSATGAYAYAGDTGLVAVLGAFAFLFILITILMFSTEG